MGLSFSNHMPMAEKPILIRPLRGSVALERLALKAITLWAAFPPAFKVHVGDELTVAILNGLTFSETYGTTFFALVPSIL